MLGSERRPIQGLLERVWQEPDQPYNEFTRYLTGAEQKSLTPADVNTFLARHRAERPKLAGKTQSNSEQYASASRRADVLRDSSFRDPRYDGRSRLTHPLERLSVSGQHRGASPDSVTAPIRDTHRRSSDDEESDDMSNARDPSRSISTRETARQTSSISGAQRRPVESGGLTRTARERGRYQGSAADAEDMIVQPASSTRRPSTYNRPGKGTPSTPQQYPPDVGGRRQREAQYQPSQPPHTYSDDHRRDSLDTGPSLHFSTETRESSTAGSSSPVTTYGNPPAEHSRKPKYFIPRQNVDLEPLKFYLKELVDSEANIRIQHASGGVKEGYIIEAVRIIGKNELEDIINDTKAFRRELERGDVPYADSKTARRRTGGTKGRR